MKLLILGAGLRAAAAAYLAKEAGFEVLITDKKATGPAVGLADGFIPFAPGTLPAADFTLPATEDPQLLAEGRARGLLFDPTALAVCRSKLACDAFLEEKGHPRPQRFPLGSEPYIVKPDSNSFGRGIWVTEDFCEVGGAVNANFLTQEELPGPVVSVLVLGRPGHYAALPVTGLECDDRYDLCRAFLPAPLPAEAAEAFAAEALTIAGELGAEGLLELQAVYHGGRCKIIEMNAQFPVLSSLALHHGAGQNLCTLLTGTEGQGGTTTPVSVSCRKNGLLKGRRAAEDAGAMQPAESGMEGGGFRIGRD